MNTLAIVIAVIVGVLVGGFLVMVALAVLGHYTEGTIFFDDGDYEEDGLCTIEPQEGGPMAYPCPTWNGFNCQCTPIFACQLDDGPRHD